MFIKNEQLSAKWKRDLNLQKKKKKLQENPEKKRQAKKKEI